MAIVLLQDELVGRIYEPGAYRLFTIYERKPRAIAAAPFRDRVVHHALMNLLEPPLDRTFIHDSYACRKGKGVHAAVTRVQGWMQRCPYLLKLDVQSYFPSIDQGILKAQLRRRIKDPGCLWLLDRIIDTAPPPDRLPSPFPGDDLLTPLEHPTGLPIGNLTSQFLANLYLDGFDHWVKEDLGTRAITGTTTSVCAWPSPPAWGELSPAARSCRVVERRRVWCAGVHEPVSRPPKEGVPNSLAKDAGERGW